MTDSYIDPYECVIYGRQACTEMRAQVMPLHRKWGGAIEHAIELQEEQNAHVEALLAQLSVSQADPDQVREAADTIVRFGSWIGSLKGRPLDAQVFFNGGAPSSVARRRLPKMVGALEHMIAKLTPHATGGAHGRETVPGAASWLEELQAAHAIAVRQRDAQKAGRTLQANLSPEIEQARTSWLATYTANKRFVEGILRHHGKEHLLPLIFDDLAEVQRTKASPDPAKPAPT